MNGTDKLLLSTALLLLSWSHSSAVELYFTDFENFTKGTNQWEGTESWVSINATNCSGIDNGVIPGFEKNTGFLGFNQPGAEAPNPTIYRPFNYDHVAANTPFIEIQTLVGVQDSTNLRRDSFLLSILNSSGIPLAALQFDNNEGLSFGIWRQDGSPTRYFTGEEFIRNNLHFVTMTIHLVNNTWSASLDGIPLFTDAPFHALGQPINLGLFAYQWDITAASVVNHGNNWLLVSDLTVNAIPEGQDPFVVDAQTIDPPRISFLGEIGFDYQVEHSDDLGSWTNTLPNSFFTGLGAPATLFFTDNSNSLPVTRNYRVRRLATP